MGMVFIISNTVSSNEVQAGGFKQPVGVYEPLERPKGETTVILGQSLNSQSLESMAAPKSTRNMK